MSAQRGQYSLGDIEYKPLGADPIAAIEDEARQYGLSVSSGARSASRNRAAGGSPTSRHLVDDARDLTGDPQKMREFYRHMRSTYGPNLKELYHDPEGGFKNGQDVAPIGGHGDHVHVAIGQRGQFKLSDASAAPTRADAADGTAGRVPAAASPSNSQLNDPLDSGITFGATATRPTGSRRPLATTRIPARAAAPVVQAPTEISKSSLGLETAFNESRAAGDKEGMERYGRMLQKEGWEAGPGADGWWYVKPPTGQRRPASQGTEKFVADVTAPRQNQPRTHKPVYIPGVGTIPAPIAEGAVDLAAGATAPLVRAAQGIARLPGAALDIARKIPMATDPTRMPEQPTAPEIRSSYESNPAEHWLGTASMSIEEFAQANGLEPGLAKELVTAAGGLAPLLLLKRPLAIGGLTAAESYGRGEPLGQSLKAGAEQAAVIGTMGVGAKGLDEAITGTGLPRAAARLAGRTAVNVAAPNIVRAATGEELHPITPGEAVMGAGFALAHGAGEKPGSEASRRAPAGVPETQAAADVSKGQAPSELVPEPPEAITAQLEALRAGRGNRRAILVPTKDQLPMSANELMDQGLTTTKTPVGVFVHSSDITKNPLALSHGDVRKMVADGSYHEALGLVEPKSPTATEAVTARDEKGTELQAAMTSPENVPAQAAELEAQHPEAKIAVEPAEQVIADRVSTIAQQSQGRYRLEDAEPVSEMASGFEVPGFAEKTEPDLHHSNYQPREEGRFAGEPTYPAEDARGAETRRAAAYDRLVALRRESEDKLFQASNLSATEADRVRAKLEALKSEATPKRPLKTVVDEYLRQGSLFGAHELNPDQQEMLRDLASPARRVKDTSEQGALFEKSPTLESRREQSQIDKAGPTFGQGGLFQRASQMIGIFNKDGRLVGTASLSQDSDPAKFVREQYGRGFTFGPLTMEGEGAKQIEAGTPEGKLFQRDKEKKQTETPEFKRWAKGARLIENTEEHAFKTGEPVVVRAYHGDLRDKVSVLSPDRAVETEGVVFFNDNPDVAEIFRYPREYGEVITEEYNEATDDYDTLEGGAVVHAYLRLENPYVLEGAEAQRATDDTAYQGEVVRKAKAAGHDGVIFKDVSEGVGDWTETGTTFGVFSATQTKSTSNRGTFDPNDPRILFQADDSPEHKILSDVIDDFAKEGITDFKTAARQFRDSFGPAHEYGEMFQEAWDANKSVKKRGKLTFDDALEDAPLKKQRTLTQAVIDNGRLKSTGFSGKGEKRMLSIKEGGRLGLFSDRGVNPEDMMRTLEAEGWDFGEDLSKFIEALRDEAGGRPHYSMEGAGERGSEEVERQWEEMGRKEFAEKSDHSLMSKAFDNPEDADYKPWVEAYDTIHESAHPEDVGYFKEVSHNLGLSPEAINRLIGSAGEYREAESKRAQSATEHAKGSATIPTDAASFKNSLVKNFNYSDEAAEATTSVADALIDTLAKESGESKESLYRQVWVTSGGKGEGLEQADAPPFYSQLQRTLESQQQGRFTPEQLEAVLRKSVKPDEMKWTGFDDFLAEKKQKGERVTKAEALEFARQNAVEVREVTKQSKSGYSYEGNEWQIAIDQAEARGDFDEAERINRAWEGIDEETGSTAGMPKFAQWQVPGGESYRELLLTLPTRGIGTNEEMRALGEQLGKANEAIAAYRRKFGGAAPARDPELSRLTLERDQIAERSSEMARSRLGSFRSSHFDEPNILAHIRFNERTDSEGKRVLFIEEVQSDWHQRGRKEGYLTPEMERLNKGRSFQNKLVAVPDAPFKTTWPDLAMKRAIRWAAENGFDKVAWTTGEQQAERYDLSKQVDAIRISGDPDQGVVIEAAPKGEGYKIIASDVPASKIEDHVGKEIAQKYAQGQTEFKGTDLKVGGEGMKGFYDRILPSVASKLGKKFGAKVGDAEIPITKDSDIHSVMTAAQIARFRRRTGEYRFYDGAGREVTPQEAGQRIVAGDGFVTAVGQSKSSVHSLDITDSMRSSAMQGQPLFQGPRGMTSFLKTGQAVIRALQNPNESTAVHEIHHALLPQFMRLAGQEGISEQFGKDMQHMSRWMGLRDAAHFNELHEQYEQGTLKGRDLKRYVDAQEKGARGFEKYLRTGVAPTPALEAAFSRFKEWLTNIYQNLKGSPIDVELGRRQQAVWDRMLGGTGDLAEGGTAAKQAKIQTERAQRGLPDIEKEAARRWPGVWAEAKADVDADGGLAVRDFAAKLAAKPRALSDSEQARLIYDRARLKNQYDKAEKDGLAAMKSGDDAAAMDADAQLAYVQDKLLDNDMALFKAGTEWGRAGAIRQLLAREDYSFERQVNRAKIKKGGDLTEQETQRFKELSAKYEDLQSQIAARDAENQSQRAYITELEKQNQQKEKVQNWRKAASGRGQRRPKEAVLADIESVKARFAELARQAGGLHQAGDEGETKKQTDTPEFKKWFGDSKVRDGQGEPLIVNHGTNESFTEFTAGEFGFHFGDETAADMQGTPMPAYLSIKNPLRMRDLGTWGPDRVLEEARRRGVFTEEEFLRLKNKTRATKAMQKRLGTADDFAPEEGFIDSRRAHYEWSKPIREALKAKGYDGIVYQNEAEGYADSYIAFDPTQIKSATGNRGTFDPKNPNILYQADKIASYEPFTPEMQKTIKELARLHVESGMRTPEEINAAIHNIVAEHFPDVTPREVGEVWSEYGKKAELSKEELDVAMREAKRQERLLVSLEDAQQGVSPERSGLQRDKMSARVKELTKQIKQAMINSGLAMEKAGPDPEKRWQTALKSYKTRVTNRIAEYQRRLDEGDFTATKKRQPLLLDQRATELRGQLEQVKADFEREQMKIENANRSVGQKALDFTVKWRRGILLSSLQTIAKLGQAAMARNISTPIEEMAGGVLRQVPGIRGVAAKAPREGGGFNPRAEGAALMTLANKALYGPEGKVTRSAIQTLKTGHSAFDVLYGGKKVRLDPDFTDFFAHAHGALKTQPKIAEFQRGFVKRMDFEYRDMIKRGLSREEARANLAEPSMQMRIGTEAYADANRAILMQDNLANSVYRSVLGLLHRAGPGGRLAEAGGRFVFPIVKVGTNYAIESGNYVVGSAGALAKLVAYKGVKNLTPEQADSVMRSFKKGSIGLGLLALGWMNPQHFGGYYQPGEKRDEDEPGAGQTRIFGHNIPKYLAHNPMLEAVQFGATARHVYDSLLKKGEKKGEDAAGASSVGASFGRAAVGLAEEVPFIGEPFRLAKDSESPSFFGKYIGENLKEMVVPPDLERIAKATDPGEPEQGAGPAAKRFSGFAPNTIKREPRGVLETVGAGIPGVRRNIPEKEGRGGRGTAPHLQAIERYKRSLRSPGAAR